MVPASEDSGSRSSAADADCTGEQQIASLNTSSGAPISIKAELERLSALAVASIQRCQFGDPVLQRCWSPDIKSTYEGFNSSIGRDALFSIFEDMVRNNPGQRTEVLDACAEVDERRGRAKVWLTVVVRGLPGNLCKEGVTLLCWERRKDEWVCWRHHGLRGVEGYT